MSGDGLNVDYDELSGVEGSLKGVSGGVHSSGASFLSSHSGRGYASGHFAEVARIIESGVQHVAGTITKAVSDVMESHGRYAGKIENELKSKDSELSGDAHKLKPKKDDFHDPDVGHHAAAEDGAGNGGIPEDPKVGGTFGDDGDSGGRLPEFTPTMPAHPRPLDQIEADLKANRAEFNKRFHNPNGTIKSDAFNDPAARELAEERKALLNEGVAAGDYDPRGRTQGFYSGPEHREPGQPANGRLASEWAAQDPGNRVIVETTDGGMRLDKQGAWSNRDPLRILDGSPKAKGSAAEVWNNASHRYATAAADAGKSVEAFVAGHDPTRAYATVEFPILHNRGVVIHER